MSQEDEFTPPPPRRLPSPAELEAEAMEEARAELAAEKEAQLLASRQLPKPVAPAPMPQAPPVMPSASPALLETAAQPPLANFPPEFLEHVAKQQAEAAEVQSAEAAEPPAPVVLEQATPEKEAALNAELDSLMGQPEEEEVPAEEAQVAPEKDRKLLKALPPLAPPADGWGPAARKALPLSPSDNPEEPAGQDPAQRRYGGILEEQMADAVRSAGLSAASRQVVKVDPMNVANIMPGIRKATSPTVTVAFPRGGWWAHTSGMSMAEIFSLYASLDEPSQTASTLIRAFLAHVEQHSVGGMPVDEAFIRRQPFSDYQAFMFGLYCATWPGKRTFTLRCPHDGCGQKVEYQVNPSQLIVSNREVVPKLKQILALPKNSKPLYERAEKTISLPVTGYSLDVTEPTVGDWLDLQTSVNPKVLKEYSSVIGLAMYVKGVYAPLFDRTAASGTPQFTQVAESIEALFSYLANMAPDDYEELEKAVQEMTSHTIEYSFMAGKCPHCAGPLAPSPVKMDDLIFIEAREVGA